MLKVSFTLWWGIFVAIRVVRADQMNIVPSRKTKLDARCEPIAHS
jgi:hypothetical protein